MSKFNSFRPLEWGKKGKLAKPRSHQICPNYFLRLPNKIFSQHKKECKEK